LRFVIADFGGALSYHIEAPTSRSPPARAAADRATGRSS
jgi:hypothetical protein